VTSAIGDLTKAGQLSRRQDNVWILRGPPPEELRHHRLVAAMS
jgi:CRP/FNR family transcriptional regulator, cyclic AMP receptor protein